MLAIAGLVRVCECSSHDGAEFGDVAHVNATHIWIKRESPAQGSVCLLLRSKRTHQILVEESRDDERVIHKPGFLDYPINLGLAGKMGNVELAAADRFYIRQRGPDKVFDPDIFGGANGRRRLLKLVASCFPKIGDQENSVGPCKCSFECLRFV